MERKQALAKLKKLIGDRFAYRFDPDAPNAEERVMLFEELQAARAWFEMADLALKARREVVLAADPEYQRLKDELEQARTAKNKVRSPNAKRITVGWADSMFFHVTADGDNWDEVVEKTRKAVKP